MIKEEAPTTAQFDGVVRITRPARRSPASSVALDTGVTVVTDADGTPSVERLEPGKHRVTLSRS